MTDADQYGLPKVFRKEGNSLVAEFFSFDRQPKPEALTPLVGRKILKIKTIFIDNYGDEGFSQQDTNGELIRVELEGGFYLNISSSGTMREPFEDLSQALIGNRFSNLEIRRWDGNPHPEEFDTVVTNYFATVQMSDAAPFDFSIAGAHHEYYGIPPYISVERPLTQSEQEREAEKRFRAQVGPWVLLAEAMIAKDGSFFYWHSNSMGGKLHGGVFTPPTPDQLRYATKSDRKHGRGRASTYRAQELRFEEWQETEYGKSPVFSLTPYNPRQPLTEEERKGKQDILNVCQAAMRIREILKLYQGC